MSTKIPEDAGALCPRAVERVSSLSTSAAQSGIIHVPYPILEEVFSEAATLVHSKRDIFPAPGAHFKESFNVTGEQCTHTVSYIQDKVELTCKDCPRFTSFKLCQ